LKKSPFTDHRYLLYKCYARNYVHRYYTGRITRMADKLKIWTQFEYTTLSRQMNNSTRSVQCWRLYYNARGYLPSGMLSFSICTDTDVHNDHRRAVLRFGYIKCANGRCTTAYNLCTRIQEISKLQNYVVAVLVNYF